MQSSPFHSMSRMRSGERTQQGRNEWMEMLRRCGSVDKGIRFFSLVGRTYKQYPFLMEFIWQIKIYYYKSMFEVHLTNLYSPPFFPMFDALYKTLDIYILCEQTPSRSKTSRVLMQNMTRIYIFP